MSTKNYYFILGVNKSTFRQRLMTLSLWCGEMLKTHWEIIKIKIHFKGMYYEEAFCIIIHRRKKHYFLKSHIKLDQSYLLWIHLYNTRPHNRIDNEKISSCQCFDTWVGSQKEILLDFQETFKWILTTITLYRHNTISIEIKDKFTTCLNIVLVHWKGQKSHTGDFWI